MEKFTIYFLSGFVLYISVCCSEKRDWYLKEIPDDMKADYAERLFRGGYSFSYQGSVAEQFQVQEALMLDSVSGDAWREKAIPYLKRGIADSFYINYEQAVKYRAEKWSGFRGYIYLYFYRDYQRAIADFDYNDELMGEVAHSQGQNHDYMRGICYYGLKNYEESLNQLTRYIEKVTSEEGAEWVDVYALLYQGLAYAKLHRYDEASIAFDKAEKLYPNLSDLFYHRARIACMRKDYESALKLLEIAKTHYNSGYYHQRPYVEVLEQVYLQSIEQLEEDVRKRMFSQV